jgi:hypothetical protein
MIPRLLISGLFVVGVLNGAPEQGTSASYSTAVASTGNQFTAGTLHISDSLAVGATLSMDHLLAGDSFDAQLDVANGGSLGLTYAMTTTYTGSDALADFLQLTVTAKKLGSACSVRDGDVLKTQGALSAAKIGDTAHGLQSGDRMLAAGATEALCFAVELPANASAALLAKDVVATFVFNAEQQSSP